MQKKKKDFCSTFREVWKYGIHQKVNAKVDFLRGKYLWSNIFNCKGGTDVP